MFWQESNYKKYLEQIRITVAGEECLGVNSWITQSLRAMLPLNTITFECYRCYRRARVLLVSFFVLWVVFPAGTALAECGDYITFHPPAKSAAPMEPLQNPKTAHTNILKLNTEELNFPVRKQPCHGPNCSKSPQRQPSPLVPASFVSTLSKEVSQVVATNCTAGNASSPLPSENTGEFPIGRSTSIYHPPRLG